MKSKSPQDMPLLHWLQTGNRPVLLGAVVLIAAALAYYTIRHQPRSEMCSLFEDHPVSQVDRQRVLMALGTANLDGYTIEQGRIMVPIGERARYLAKVKEEGALPRPLATEEEFSPNPLLPNSQIRRLEQHQKKKQVGSLILKLPYVEDAWFEVDFPNSSTMFDAARPSAVVMVKPRQDAVLNLQQVETIQRLVSAAFASMDKRQVAVIDSNGGVAYQDLTDHRQSRLIETVNWTWSRRQHYLRCLENLRQEFPGIYVDVVVDRVDDGDQTVAEDRVAVETDRNTSNLAVPVASESVPRTGIGLNQGAEIGRQSDDLPVSPRPQEVTGETTKLVLYRQDTAFQTRFQESVRVDVRVPRSVLCSLEWPTVQKTDDVAAKFEVLQQEIIAKIRQLIPATVLANPQSISVLLLDAGATRAQNPENLAIAPMVQRYWPVACGVFLALFGVYWSRVQDRPEEGLSLATDGKVARGVNDPLRDQLSDLIDNDPDTAAQVLRNWIEQADG